MGEDLQRGIYVNIEGHLGLAGEGYDGVLCIASIFSRSCWIWRRGRRGSKGGSGHLGLAIASIFSRFGDLPVVFRCLSVVFFLCRQ